MSRPSVDYAQGSVRGHIIRQAIPLTIAQIVHLLYNVVDRIYIGHLPQEGNLALTGLGLAFPIIVLIAAFTNLFGQGGTPLFSIARGKGDEEEAKAILGNVFLLLSISALVLFVLCYPLRRPLLFLFGASSASIAYADAYLQIYLFGILFSMLTTGLNSFINAQGFPKIGMMTTLLGAVVNILLDPLFIFVLGMGVRGAALATVLSQGVSALWVLLFLTGKRTALPLRLSYMRLSLGRVKRILSLGFTGFVMQGTNSLVSIVCNNQLQLFGGDLYVGVMTVLHSIREILSLPVTGVCHGSQPVMGFNYGARQPRRVRDAIRFCSVLSFVYTLVAWVLVMLLPRPLMSIFAESEEVILKGIDALRIYFFGFVFMAFQSAGQTTFQALGFARQAIFFSMLRKVVIVVPLTLLLPALGFGVNGVFLAEPISNALGGLACFLTMWFTVERRLDASP